MRPFARSILVSRSLRRRACGRWTRRVVRLRAHARSAAETHVRAAVPDRSEPLGTDDQLPRSGWPAERSAISSRYRRRTRPRRSTFSSRVAFPSQSTTCRCLLSNWSKASRSSPAGHGVGRLESTSNGRTVVYDAPAAMVLHTARAALGDRSGVVRLSVLNGGCTVVGRNTEVVNLA